VYRYYDAAANVGASSGRTNNAETIAEAAASSGLSTASVQQFMLQDRGTSASDPRHLYIQPGGRFELRISETMKMLRGEPVRNTEGKMVSVTEIPRFLAIYGDDLDAAGHNGTGYGTIPSLNVEAWTAKMIAELVRLDKALGVLIDGLRELGIFEETAIVLTADHGMTPYWGKSSLMKLVSIFTSANLKVKIVENGVRAPQGTDVVFVTSGQAVQIYLRNEVKPDTIASLATEIASQPYVGGVMDRAALDKAGASASSGDMVVWPEPPNHFSTKDINYGIAANHDTRHPSSHNVFFLVSGVAVRHGLVIDTPIEIIDAAPTMSALLGIRPPANATGRVLTEALQVVADQPHI
jgi:predicted AlkP superfamily pyrophosphatase or phosphodiesterase